MPQTLLAVGALALTLLLALSSQEAVVHMEDRKIDGEIEMLAGQVALNVLAHVAAQPFDANTAAGTVTDAADLTDAAAFPTGLAYAAATDIDDFHRMATHTYTTADGIDFDIDITVRYVDETLQASTVPTFQKEVTVTVQHERMRSPATISRIVSWPS